MTPAHWPIRDPDAVLRQVKRAATGFVTALWLLGIAASVLRFDHYFWDFRIYHEAARQFLAGRDPYSELNRVYVGYGWAALPFVYPPCALFLIAPLGLVSLRVAALCWLGLKMAALVSLFRVWKRMFVPIDYDWKFGIFLLLGFNAALYTDLVTGNIALFEVLALYAAVDALLRDRVWAFTALVLAVSAFKFLPIVFLGLLPVFAGRKGLRPALYGSLIFVLYVALNVVLLGPRLSEFLAILSGRDEDRANNPTLYTFFRDLGARGDFNSWWLLYMVAAAVVALATYKVLRGQVALAPPLAAMYLWTAYALLTPRFMIYTYVELIPMAWLALSRLKGSSRWVLAGLAMFITPTSYLFIQRPALGQALARLEDIGPATYGYFSMFAALIIWVTLGKMVVQAGLSCSKLSPVATGSGQVDS